MSLTLQFVPHQEVADLGSARRVKKLIDIVKQNKIVLLEGRLRKEEEKDLIEITMEEINSKFKGIELAVIDSESKEPTFTNKLKLGLMNALVGNRIGFTVIGPASVVKEIKKNPDKIELYTQEKSNSNSKSRKNGNGKTKKKR